MKITLDTSGPNILIKAEDGRDILIQTDYDYPGTASTFGWSPRAIQPESGECDHTGTDGTVKCPDCGMSASAFICAAYQFLMDNAGKTVRDPGYF